MARAVSLVQPPPRVRLVSGRRLDDRLSVCASVVMFALASLPACFLMVPRFRELDAVRKTLDEQLGSFRVSNAHTSRPEDEAALLAKISQLYPAKDGQSSTSAFEAFVRGPLRSTVSIRVKGGWLVGHSRLPLLVPAFLPWVWVFADAICEHPTPMLVSRFPVSAVWVCCNWTLWLRSADYVAVHLVRSSTVLAALLIEVWAAVLMLGVAAAWVLFDDLAFVAIAVGCCTLTLAVHRQR